MKRPDPITQRLMPNYLQMSMPQNGVDPLAPQQPPQQPMGVGMGMMQPTPQGAPPNGDINFAAMSQPSMGRDPLAPKPKAFGEGGVGWKILGIIGDGLRGAGGLPPMYAPVMQDMMQQQAEEDRFRRRLEAEQAARMEMARQKASEPTDLEQRVAALNRLGQGLGDTYAKNYANNGGSSLQIFRDPGTGQAYQVGAAPSSRTVNGVTYYNINGKWYDNPEGR